MKVRTENDILNAMEYTNLLAESIGFSPKEQILLRLVTEEALVNALEHGSTDKHGEVEVAWEIEKKTIELAVKQEGHFFKLESLEPSTFALRGRGLSLILGIMDRVWLEEESGKVILYMRKHFKEEGKKRA